MLKKILLSGLLICLSWVLRAQDSVSSRHHPSQRWELTVSAGNFGPDDQTNPFLVPGSFNNRANSQNNYACTFGLSLSRKISRSLSMQFGCGYSHPVQSSHVETSENGTPSGQPLNPGFYVVEDIVSQEKVAYASLGFTRRLMSRQRYSLHAGMDAVYLQYWDKKGESKSREYILADPSYPNPFRNEKQVSRGEEANALGIRSFVGIDVHLCRSLVLGSDFSMAYLYNHLYGARSEEIDLYNSWIPQSSSVTLYPRSVRSFGFSPLRYTFNLTYLF